MSGKKIISNVEFYVPFNWFKNKTESMEPIGKKIVVTRLVARRFPESNEELIACDKKKKSPCRPHATTDEMPLSAAHATASQLCKKL